VAVIEKRALALGRMAPQDREQIHWAWVPAASFFGVSLWVRYGPVVSILAAGSGIALGLYGRKKRERRREAERLRRPPE
jgi:hypothetical protein